MKKKKDFIGWIFLGIIIASFGVGCFSEKEGETLPEAPIIIKKRQAITADTLVAMIYNSDNDILNDIKLILYGRDGKLRNKGTVERILPGDFIEVGPLEDWYILDGYSIEVRIDGYADKTWGF